MNNEPRPTTTTDQADQNGLPPIQSFFRNVPTTQSLTDFSQNNGPQEYESHPNNYDEQINRSVLVNSLADNPTAASQYSINTNERSNMVPSMGSTQQQANAVAGQIKIKYHPRQYYHPRTQKECEKTSCYIHGENGPYPTIHIFLDWAVSAMENWIEVALMTVGDQPHPYHIDNKKRKSSNDELLVWRNDNENLLYFRVTADDFTGGVKSLLIELVKRKQDGSITKQMIDEQQLQKSKFRFTRTYYDVNEIYHRDEASTVYSEIMTEKYGDVVVDYINPQYGPIGGNHRLDVVFTGLKAKDKQKMSFKIVEPTTGWVQEITNFNSKGNIIDFVMPAYPYPNNTGSVKTNVIVYYEGDEIFNSSYVYVVELDPILDRFGLNILSQVEEESTTSKSDTDGNQASTNNPCSSSTVPKTTPKKNVRKRKHDD